jgi:hypothetical protein
MPQPTAPSKETKRHPASRMAHAEKRLLLRTLFNPHSEERSVNECKGDEEKDERQYPSQCRTLIAGQAYRQFHRQ